MLADPVSCMARRTRRTAVWTAQPASTVNRVAVSGAANVRTYVQRNDVAYGRIPPGAEAFHGPRIS
jgi:hypothetical protein